MLEGFARSLTGKEVGGIHLARVLQGGIATGVFLETRRTGVLWARAIELRKADGTRTPTPFPRGGRQTATRLRYSRVAVTVPA